MERNGTGINKNGHFGAKGIIKTSFQWTTQGISIKLFYYTELHTSLFFPSLDAKHNIVVQKIVK